MHVSTDLAAVRVPEDEVSLYNVTGGGWYAIDGEDKAVLGPFESLGLCDRAIRDRVSLMAPPDVSSFPVPRFIEAGLATEKPGHASESRDERPGKPAKNPTKVR
jgi:hypothetical protein